MLVQRISDLTGQLNSMDIPSLHEADLNKYLVDRSMCPACSLSDLLPQLTEDERIFVSTGVTQDEWDEFDRNIDSY